MRAFIHLDNDKRLRLSVEPDTTTERTMLEAHGAELGLVSDPSSPAWTLDQAKPGILVEPSTLSFEGK